MFPLILVSLSSLLRISETIPYFSHDQKAKRLTRDIEHFDIQRGKKHKEYLGELFKMSYKYYAAPNYGYDKINNFYKALEKKHSFSKIGEKSNNTFNVPKKLNLEPRKDWQKF